MCGIMAGIAIASTVAGGIATANAQKKAASASRSAAQGQSAAAISEGFAKQEAQFANQEASKFSSDTALLNVEITDRLAADAISRGRLEEAKSRIGAKQTIGRQRVQAAASGQVVDEGSVLDITSDTAAIGELDALVIRANAAREAQGFKDRGFNLRRESIAHLTAAGEFGKAANTAFQSGLASSVQLEKAGKAAIATGKANVTATLINTGANVATKWATFGS